MSRVTPEPTPEQQAEWALENKTKLETFRRLRSELRARGILGLDGDEPEVDPVDPLDYGESKIDLPEIEERGVSEEAAAGEPRPHRVRKTRLDTATIGAQLLRGRIEGAKAGRHQSGPAPYGFRRAGRPPCRVLVVDEREAEVVKLIFREYLRLRSMKRLVELLAARGSRTRRGLTWSRTTLAWVLKNDVYVGRVHFGEVHARGTHEALVAPITFNKAQCLMRENDKRKPCRHGRQASSCVECRMERLAYPALCPHDISIHVTCEACGRGEERY